MEISSLFIFSQIQMDKKKRTWKFPLYNQIEDSSCVSHNIDHCVTW